MSAAVMSEEGDARSSGFETKGGGLKEGAHSAAHRLGLCSMAIRGRDGRLKSHQ